MQTDFNYIKQFVIKLDKQLQDLQGQRKVLEKTLQVEKRNLGILKSKVDQEDSGIEKIQKEISAMQNFKDFVRLIGLLRFPDQIREKE